MLPLLLLLKGEEAGGGRKSEGREVDRRAQGENVLRGGGITRGRHGWRAGLWLGWAALLRYWAAATGLLLLLLSFLKHN